MRAIGGAYTLEKEFRLPHADQEVLVVVGNTFIDTSCCGVTGWRYAFVPGYLHGWQDQKSEEGLPVSAIEPIRDRADQRAIEETIRGQEPVQSIEFW